MKNNLFVDIHVLQTIPPSCINRDDTGRPKTAEYGGAQRALASSQSWKHAMREMFREEEMMPTGIRTKEVDKMITSAIESFENTTPDPEKTAELALRLVKHYKEDVLFFISPAEIELFAKDAVLYEKERQQVEAEVAGKDKKEKDKALKKVDDNYKKMLKKDLASEISPDIQLFGRMFASDSDLNVDAAAQVAFAIGTHPSKVEIDFFSAIDEKKSGTGAGHIDTQEFDSGVFYRYANVNAKVLKRTYGEATGKIVRNYVKAFVLSMPSGKMNSHGNRTKPAYIYVTIQQDQPVYMGEAFECPVKNRGEGYMGSSKDTLKKYAKDLYAVYGMPAAAFSTEVGNADGMSFPDLLDAVEQKVTELFT